MTRHGILSVACMRCDWSSNKLDRLSAGSDVGRQVKHLAAWKCKGRQRSLYDQVSQRQCGQAEHIVWVGVTDSLMS